ncbi:hypothetical protein JW824_01535 [bacterium]|nr:hypothetical protein [bacterium]
MLKPPWPKKETIQSLLNSHLPKKLKRYSEWQMLIILIFILFGDLFKWGHLFRVTQYNWIQGHFSDIGLTAQFTTAIFYLRGHKEKGSYYAFFFPPFFFTLYEMTQYPNSDPVDILCYFLGSGIALMSLKVYQNKLNRKRRIRNR